MHGSAGGSVLTNPSRPGIVYDMMLKKGRIERIEALSMCGRPVSCTEYRVLSPPYLRSILLHVCVCVGSKAGGGRDGVCVESQAEAEAGYSSK